jgi:transcriptional regulator with XRE-family HTH domain
MSAENGSIGNMTVGERLKHLRLKEGLSQRDLAAPGVSYAYISRIEAGTREPSVKALRKLAARLGVSTFFLETGSEDPALLLASAVLSEKPSRPLVRLANQVMATHAPPPLE